VYTFVENVCAIHVVRKKANFNGHSDELRWYIKVLTADRNSGIIVYLSLYTVMEAFIMPFLRLWMSDMRLGLNKTIKRSFSGG
jgi:hypothetical protein